MRLLYMVMQMATEILFDFAQIKRSILGIADPSGVYWKAADCNRDGELDLFDFAKVKRYILGIGSINQ
mgnify:CR=1 FL=1